MPDVKRNVLFLLFQLKISIIVFIFITYENKVAIISVSSQVFLDCRIFLKTSPYLEKGTGPARETRQSCTGLPTVTAFLTRVPPCSGYLLQPVGNDPSPLAHLFTTTLHPAPTTCPAPSRCSRSKPTVDGPHAARVQRVSVHAAPRSKPLHRLPPSKVPTPLCGTHDTWRGPPKPTSDLAIHSQFRRLVFSVIQVFPFHLDYSLCLFLPFEILWEDHCLYHLPSPHIWRGFCPIPKDGQHLCLASSDLSFLWD